jgi:hypothetical protein
MPAAETGAVPKPSTSTHASPADYNNVPSSDSNMYPNIFPLPSYVAPYPPHMPFHSNSVFNSTPLQAVMQHTPTSKYYISDWLMSGEVAL